MAKISELERNINEDAFKLAIGRLQQKLEIIYQGGGQKRIEKEHAQGKLTARERVDYLIDEDSEFFEIGAFAGYGMYEEYGGCPAGGVVVGIGYVSRQAMYDCG